MQMKISSKKAKNKNKKNLTFLTFKKNQLYLREHFLYLNAHHLWQLQKIAQIHF